MSEFAVDEVRRFSAMLDATETRRFGSEEVMTFGLELRHLLNNN